MRAGWTTGLLAAFLLMAPSGRAQEAATGIREVISRQIEAFRADDFGTAFSFASPNIQQLFGSPERFGQMVREGYPMVWRPGDVRFSDLLEQDGRTVQHVLVTDQSGAFFVLEYDMIAGPQGWRIDGVQLLRQGEVGA